MVTKRKRGDLKLSEAQVDALFSAEPLEDGPIDEPVLRKNDSEDSVKQDGGNLPPVAAHIFETVTGDGRQEFPPIPDIKRGFQEIIRDLFEDGLSVTDEYATIRESLSIKGALTPDAVMIAANRVEEMADRAYRLYCIAQNEYSTYMREIGVIEAAMRDGAIAELERQKANKLRTKQITEADIATEMAQSFPDEWNEVQNRKTTAKLMTECLENLSSLAKSRCFSVSKMQRD